MIDAFFDIDGTLINEFYEFNAPLEELLSEVRGLKGKVNFHLNSNRSLSSIVPIWEKMGFSGLIIYENGLGVYNPLTGKDEIETGEEIEKEELKNILSDNGKNVFFIDTDELIRNSKKFSTGVSKPIYCEQTRRYTATIYPRVTVNGVPVPDEQYLQEIAERVTKTFENSYTIKISPKYSNILLTPKHVTKSNYMKTIGQGHEIASFGDETQDIDMFRESNQGLIGCPANASKEVKDFIRDRKGFISTFFYTSGAVEFIREVLKK